MALELRALNATDADEYRRVRLNALQMEPSAYSSSYETALEQPRSFFINRASFKPDNFLFGAWDAASLIGMAGGYVDPELKRQHIGHVVSVWVEPEYRRQGLARQLTMLVMDQLQSLQQVTQIQLVATAGNQAAISLYEGFGFQAWGEEPRSIRVNDDYYNDIHMYLNLSPD